MVYHAKSRNFQGILTQHEPLEVPRKRFQWFRQMARSKVFHLAALLFVFVVYFGRTSSTKIRNKTPSLGISTHLTHTWAEYSPYFAVDEYRPPAGCRITQVNILQRHGARYPTSGATDRITASIEKFTNVSTFHDDDLEFLRSYKYDLGLDDLVPFGAAQSFDAGQEAFERYHHLVSKHNPPFIRASSASRVVDSATNWTAGFFFASGGVITPPPPLILSEAANDTLDDEMCANAGGSDAQTTVWQDTFGPAVVARLNRAAPGANLSNSDIPNLISLCPFESVAKEKESHWCDVFKPEDFADFDYYGDVDKYYNTGYGQALGPVQGVGYVNELLARLTDSPVNDSTQTNSTLDKSPVTFPLDKTIYADFSHDNQMIAIYAAMGIMRPAVALDPTRPDPHRFWRASHLVPFSGRLVTERLDCGGRGAAVRMLIDDAVVPLDICGGGHDGICSLDDFVRSQEYARNNGEGDWAKCFA